MKRLLIIESPNKKKKISEILGPGWVVMASVGHIRDLVKGDLGVDRMRDYAPRYEVDPGKRNVVSGLLDQVRIVGPENVYLATDPDREGASIAYHLCATLKLNFRETKRVEFHELSPKAIQAAISNPGKINVKLVQAQEARRVIDRLVGWEVSDMLRRKLGGNLSAGRVQSVAVRMVVERERVIEGFADKFTFKVKGEFATEHTELIKAVMTQAFATDAEARAYIQSVTGKSFHIKGVEHKTVTQRPPAPFITSTLQQEAIRKFKWSARKVMDVAQALFSQGHISYMRTDSPNLSEEAIEAIRQQLKATVGESHFQANRFKAKESAQEAHEAIRPTHFEQENCGETTDEQRLYKLIYDRAMASQMKPAIYQQTIISIEATPGGEIYEAKARVMEYAGYRMIYQEADEDGEKEDGTTLKHPARQGDRLTPLAIEAKQTFSTPPKRFDEATLVKELEAKGIGRPSTYASILSNIVSRHYIEEGNRPGRKVQGKLYSWRNGQLTQADVQQTIGSDSKMLVPTDVGIRIVRYLEERFSRLVDYAFTAQMEESLDGIVEGQRKYVEVVKEFDLKHSSMIQVAAQATPDIERERKTTILGQHEGETISAGQGEHGPYVLWCKEFFKVEGVALADITMEVALAAIAAKKQKAEAYKAGILHKVGKYEIRKGQFGLYMIVGEKRVPLKNYTEDTVKELTVDQCKQITAEYEVYLKHKSKSGSGKSGSGSKGGSYAKSGYSKGGSK